MAEFLAEGEPALHAFGEGQIDHAFVIEGLIVADIRRGAGLELVDRLVGDDVDQAGGGVAAEQGALRPFQHLDTFNIEDRAGIHERVGVGNLVDIGPHRGGR